MVQYSNALIDLGFKIRISVKLLLSSYTDIGDDDRGVVEVLCVMPVEV